jgi:hypothetical protein
VLKKNLNKFKCKIVFVNLQVCNFYIELNQTKSEKKELLMEHLATIIEQNEMRKAEKLAKIMEELGI